MRTTRSGRDHKHRRSKQTDPEELGNKDETLAVAPVSRLASFSRHAHALAVDIITKGSCALPWASFKCGKGQGRPAFVYCFFAEIFCNSTGALAPPPIRMSKRRGNIINEHAPSTA